MSHPFISVIVPSYNQGAFIANTLDSIIRQKYTDWEIVIQDGGSADQTAAAVKTYTDSDHRITFQSEKDKGFSDAVNKALLRCKGEYVIIQNSDDFFSGPEVFGDAVSYLKKYEGLYLLSAPFKKVDDKFNELLIPETQHGEGFIDPFDLYTLRRTFGQSSTFFSLKRILDIGLLSLNVDMVADTDTWIRMAGYDPIGEKKIYYAPGTWSCATFHHEQRSADQSKFMIGRAQMYTDLYFDRRLAFPDAEKKRTALLFVTDAYEYLIQRKMPTEKVEGMYQKITGTSMPLKKIVKKNLFRVGAMRNLVHGKVVQDGTAYYLTFPRGKNYKWFN